MASVHRLRFVVLRMALASAAALAVGPAAGASAEEASARTQWSDGPGRPLGAASLLLPGRAVLFDEGDDPETRAILAAALRRFSSEAFEHGGWRSPYEDGEPLRIYVSRGGGGSPEQRTPLSRGEARPIGPRLVVDGTGLTASQVADRVTRQIARATLEAYGVAPDPFLSDAMTAVLSHPWADSGQEDEAWTVAAAPELDLREHPSSLGRLWLEEIQHQTGDATFLRRVWERSSETGEAPMPVLKRMLAEASPVSAAGLLARAAARLYASLEPEAGPSRLRMFDLTSGVLDAAAPAELRVSHRSFLPEGTEEALLVNWPEDGSAGAAVVRYRDTALPPDVVFFSPGDSRSIPLAGVARVDWVVAGEPDGGRGIRAPVYCAEGQSELFTGLEARASAGAEKPRIAWKTSSHSGLWGWAVFREEVRPDGRIARTGPEIVPSSERAQEPYGYAFVDTTAANGGFYRYTVWAVSDEGLLARAFAVTLRAGE